MNFLDFVQFLAGAAREKLSNCVSPIGVSQTENAQRDNASGLFCEFFADKNR